MEYFVEFWNAITTEYSQPDMGFFTTIISIAFGAVTLFISLSIIPFQKLSETVSGYLYKILIKDKKTQITLGISLLVSFLELFCVVFIKDNLLSRLLYILGLFIIFLVLCIYSINILKMLDITTSIFPALTKHLETIIKNVQKIEKKAKQNPYYKFNDLQNQIKNAILSQEKPENYPEGSVFDGCAKAFSYKFSFLYDLILKNLEKLDYASYETCIDGLEKCLDVYFGYINNHYIVFDNFFLDFIEHSKKIISEANKKDSSLYFEYYGILFEKIIDKLNNLNIPKEFYQDQIITFLFDYMYIGRKSIADCVRYIQKSYDFIIDGKTNRVIYDKYIRYFEELLSIIYKNGTSIEKSNLNYLINVFTYKVLSCKSNLYDNQVVLSIIELQENEDANNLLPPTLVFDDFTTNIAVGMAKEDKSLASCAVHFLLSQEEIDNDLDNQNRNLYRINVLYRIIEVLKVRYNKGGTYISGIDEQLFVIFFNIILLLNEDLFKYYTRANWNYVFSKKEKLLYLDCLLEIIKITAKGKNQFTRDSNLLFSELKLLVFLLLDDKLFSINLTNFIWSYKKELCIYVLNNPCVDKKMIREIYRFLFIISPKNIRKHILRKLSIMKNEHNPKFFFFDERFDTSQLWLQGVSMISYVDKNVQKIVNKKIEKYLRNVQEESK